MKKFLRNTGVFAAYFLLTSVMLSTVAHAAYVDPSVTAPIIQVLAGVVIAAGAAIGIFWKKIKNAFTKKKYQNIEKNIEKKAAQRNGK